MVPVSEQAQRFGDSEAKSATSFIHGLPIPTWSSRSLQSIWWSTSKDNGKNHADAANLATMRGTELVGTLRNPLPVAIRDAAVVYGRLYYQIGTLQPGQRFDLIDAQGRDFRYRLTRRRILDEDGREIVQPWDKASFDVPRIMEMMMFHDRAGGKSYTNLQQRYHRELDLSDHLVTGTAILTGRLDRPATNWTCGDLSFSDDDSQHWTYCRILFPVQKEDAID